MRRERILREIRDDQLGAASKVFVVHVRNLRQKLEEGAGRAADHPCASGRTGAQSHSTGHLFLRYGRVR